MGKGLGRGKLKKEGKNWVAHYTDANGKRHRYNFGPNKADAQLRLNKAIRDRDMILSGLAEEVAGDWRSTPISRVVRAYMASLENKQVTDRYRRDTQNNLDRVVRALHLRRAGDVTEELLSRHIKKWAKEGLANTTVHAYLSALKRAWTYSKLPWPSVSMPSLARHHRPRPARALTLDEQEKLLEQATGPRSVELLFMLDTGARHSETRRLKWKDLGPNQVKLRAETTKNGTERTIPLSKRLQIALASRPALGVWVFPRIGGTGQQTNSSQFNAWVQKTAQAAGIPLKTDDGHFHAHALRHTFITRLAMAGVPIQQAQYLSGHKTLDVLLGIYTHLRVDDVRSAIDKL